MSAYLREVQDHFRDYMSQPLSSHAMMPELSIPSEEEEDEQEIKGPSEQLINEYLEYKRLQEERQVVEILIRLEQARESVAAVEDINKLERVKEGLNTFWAAEQELQGMRVTAE